MESATVDMGKIHVLFINLGEDVLKSIQQFALDHDIKQAIILNGFGALMRYQVHWVLHNQLPSKAVMGSGEGGIEMVSLSGIILNHTPHVHVTLANAGGAFGGHMEEGCMAYVICEVYIAEVSGPQLAHVRLPAAVSGIGEGTTFHLTQTQ